MNPRPAIELRRNHSAAAERGANDTAFHSVAVQGHVANKSCIEFSGHS